MRCKPVHSYLVSTTKPVSVMTGHLDYAKRWQSSARWRRLYCPAQTAARLVLCSFSEFRTSWVWPRKSCGSSVRRGYGVSVRCQHHRHSSRSSMVSAGDLDLVGATDSAFHRTNVTVSPSYLGCNMYRSKLDGNRELWHKRFGSDVVSSDEGQESATFSAYIQSRGLFYQRFSDRTFDQQRSATGWPASHPVDHAQIIAHRSTVKRHRSIVGAGFKSLTLNADQFYDYVVDRKRTYQSC